MTIFPGQKIRIARELIEDITENKIQFIDEGNQFLLIEFPAATIPAFMESLFFELQKTGVTTIIVHPERNHVSLNDPNGLCSLIEKGALAQLTAGSYVGSFGKKIENLANN
nr:CpsB/CapC family capsule biosynthesis tyrosine phosphatase [Carnobacterium pleistocenium]